MNTCQIDNRLKYAVQFHGRMRVRFEARHQQRICLLVGARQPHEKRNLDFLPGDRRKTMSKIAVCQTMVKQPLSVIGEVDQPCFAAQSASLSMISRILESVKYTLLSYSSRRRISLSGRTLGASCPARKCEKLAGYLSL